jgi:processive 1,2-diacylglycerol beta-glucosyltransferase/1,2-diacylglycerol 3-beta-galactosyltransferase
VRTGKSQIKSNSEPHITIAAVCGRNDEAKRNLSRIAREFPDFDLHLFGYLDCIPELMQLSDCIITKAGASIVMESLACHKPVIFSTFIHGQEQGNVRFVVQNGCGRFIRKPEGVLREIIKLASDPVYYAQIVANLEKLNVRSDLEDICRFIAKGENT